jgi:hypothetical protein
MDSRTIVRYNDDVGEKKRSTNLLVRQTNMAADHFETKIQPEEYSGDPRDSLSVAEMIEVNEWPDFDASKHGLINLSAPIKADRVVSGKLYNKPTARLMVFGQWGGDTHHREVTKAMLWQEWC